MNKISQCLSISQFIIEEFADCLGNATTGEQRPNTSFLGDPVKEQRRLDTTQLDAKRPKH